MIKIGGIFYSNFSISTDASLLEIASSVKVSSMCESQINLIKLIEDKHRYSQHTRIPAHSAGSNSFKGIIQLSHV